MSDDHGIRIELGPQGYSEDNKIILPDGRDIMDDLLPKSIEILIEAGKPTACTIITEATRSAVVDLMPEFVTIECTDESLLGERTEALIEAGEFIGALLAGSNDPSRSPEYYAGMEAVHSAFQNRFWPPEDQMGPDLSVVELEGSKNGTPE
jgi:hypothetical protein